MLGTEADKKKITRARTKIIFLVDPVNYVQVESAKTAKEVWDNLTNAFEDRGLTRRVGLLRTLITTRLLDSNSVEDYVNKIINTAHKLSNVGMQVNDEWIGTILLVGLPDKYKPMIMGLENCGMPITSDGIKMKLLQDVKHEEKKDDSCAMFSGKNKPNGKYQYKKSWRCYQCNKYGHICKVLQ